jgi:excisionase family DNA binding protein
MSKLMTAQEAADYLRLNVQTIYNLIHQKRLTPLRIGKDIRFDQTKLNEFMHRHTPMTLEEAALHAGLEPDAAFTKEYQKIGDPVTLENMETWKMLKTDPRRARIGTIPLTAQSLTDRADALADRVGGTVWRCPLCPPRKGYRVRCRCLACETPVCLACSQPDMTGPLTVLGQSRICRECLARREAPPAGPGPRALAEDEGDTDRLVRADRTGTPPEPGVTRGRIKTDLRRVTLYGDKA